MRSLIDIRLAGYMLESGEGSLDEVKSLLDHVNSEFLKLSGRTLRVGGECGRGGRRPEASLAPWGQPGRWRQGL